MSNASISSDRDWLSSKSNVELALEALRNGRMIVLVDDEDRENEGDLVQAAQFVTPESINFMAMHGRGLICLALESKWVDSLQLPLMTENNQAQFQTAFTVSIEARQGVSTGISAADRAHTIQTAIRDGATRADLSVPGHVFPLRARDGGVLVRAGQTEGSVDLSRLAGLKSAAVICEIMNDDGTMSRMPQLREFSSKWNLPIVSIADLITYRLHTDADLISFSASSKLPTKYNNTAEIRVYESKVDGKEHVALVFGDPKTFSDRAEGVLVRVHSECLTGDVLGSLRCDCGSQLDLALQKLATSGAGVLLYLRQEGRGIGLLQKIKAYALQDGGLDTVEANQALGFGADLRQYGIGAQILRHIGVRRMKLLSNNPKKMVGLSSFGLELMGREPLIVPPSTANVAYLETKKNKMGHLL